MNDTWRNFTIVDGKTKMLKIDNLEKGTTYQFRMDSKNKYGTGELKSEVLTARTKGDETGGNVIRNQ